MALPGKLLPQGSAGLKIGSATAEPPQKLQMKEGQVRQTLCEKKLYSNTVSSL